MSEVKTDVNRVCVIGAGASGLSAIRHSIDRGCNVVCYERAKELGGTWVIHEHDENIAFEDDVLSCMYEGLRTNLPKEIMGYPDFPFPNDCEGSFISSDGVLKFLQRYAEHFHLNEYIRFQHEVVRVRPRNNGTLWEVCVRDRQTEAYLVEYFDFIFVCNGRYFSPKYPVIKNMENYKGKQMHSHIYRRPEPFKDETVLVIGGGPSGIDISSLLFHSSVKVILSHHSPKNLKLASGIIQKPDIDRFTENGAIFVDGSIETFSVVIYCTGYNVSFPFLSIDCGVHLKGDSVYPLYKHVMNINNPSMAFIGLPNKVLPVQAFDLQVRFALKFFLKEKYISPEDMLRDLENDIQERLESGSSLNRLHELAHRQYDYYADLAAIGDLTPIKPVINDLMKICTGKFVEYETYRDWSFKLLDDFRYEKFKMKQTNT